MINRHIVRAPGASAALPGLVGVSRRTCSRARVAGLAAVRVAQRLAVTACVAAAIIVTVASTVLPVLGYRMMVVTGGSMQPELWPGDIALVRRVAPSSIRTGDVITFRAFGADRPTTHRVVDVVSVDSRPHFRTQGKANVTPDPNLAPPDGLIGRMVLRVPRAGTLMFSSMGRLVLVAVPLAWVIAAQWRAPFPGRSHAHRGERHSRRLEKGLVPQGEKANVP